MGSS
jgi:hypothetical protein